jgi:glutamyl-tRNA reductase
MRDIVLIGINHKTAPVEVRECIAFSKDEMAQALETLRLVPHILETLLYSTCNRVELIFVTDDKHRTIGAAKTFIADFNKIPLEQFESCLYVHENDAAVRHLFRVVSSMDSMIIGEPQILGQIKEAYRHAAGAKTSGVVLNRLMHRAFFVAKRIRTETGIGDRAVSISYAAVELARKIFGTLEGKRVLMIGAGEMAEVAVEHLLRHPVAETIVANRTFETGLELARRFNGRAVRFEEIAGLLKIVDIIISSTGSPSFIITREDVKAAVRARRNRPIFFIDIAVPRDIDPEINRMDNAYVYDIDDLKGIIEENIEDRKTEAIKGERIIDEAIIRFREWHEALDVVPTIVALRKKLEAMADSEIKRTLQGHALPAKDAEPLQRMMSAYINKVLHEPTAFLKKNGMHGDKSLYVDTVRKLFKLDE